MVIGCGEVREAVRLGDESQDVLEHLAQCAACRAHAESTMFLEDGTTERRSPAALPRARLPWIVALSLVPLIGVLAVVAVLRVRRAGSAVETTRASSVKVTPLERPVAAPAAALRSLWVDSDPGATVYIDGDVKGPTPWHGQVPPGRLVVEVRAEGWKSARKVVQVGDEDPAPLGFMLDRAARAPARAGAESPAVPAASDRPARPVDAERRAEAPAAAVGGEERPTSTAAKTANNDPPAPAARDLDERSEPVRPVAPRPAIDEAKVTGFGYLSITTEPWAKVILDGKDIGRTTPLTRYTTPAGHHSLELRARTGSITLEINVKPKQELEIDKTIE